MSYRITMIGAGSVGFSVAVARELANSKLLSGSTFVLMDIDQERLSRSAAVISGMIEQAGKRIRLESISDRRIALAGADFVITSFAPSRMDFWIKDIEIAAGHGIHLLQGENGGPAGQIHALRNITIMMDIIRDMEAICPGAWLMNFTNPMSMLCTYLHKNTKIKSLGFCHQVHGSFGVIAEMLGMEPGDLQVVTAGINHMNFLLDIRRKGTGKSYKKEFLSRVKKSPYWQKNHDNVPEQVFTLDFLKTFGIYPVGYDNHIGEYIPFFYSKEECDGLGYRPCVDTLNKLRAVQKESVDRASGTIDDVEPERILGKGLFPFPRDPAGPYYKEMPVKVMEALVSSTPLYLDSLVVVNRGCVANLPADAVVDIPVMIAGGEARGVFVGDLPCFAAELCRRQIAVHELVVKAAITGDRSLFLQALCLDPFVHGLRTARALMDDYLNEYRDYLPQFHS